MRHPISRRTVLAGLAAVPAALALPPALASAAVSQRPGQKPAADGLTVLDAGPHAGLTTAFTAYGDSGQGWTGADSTYSLALPGARQLWMFSDTFLGTVEPDGSRASDTPIVNNTFVVRRHGDMRTIHGGTAQAPQAILSPTQPDSWYWLGGSYLGAGAVNIMFLRFQRTGPGMWDWAWQENVLGRFRVDDLTLLGTYPMPSAAKIQWASWLDRHGAHTYVYGVEDHGLTKYMHVARVRGDDLRHPWEYFDGQGWSPHETDSARIMAGVANEYSVTRWRGRYLLVTHDTNTLFSNQILGYVSAAPTGPFTHPTLLYTTPETGALGSYGDPDVITYNSHEHPELRRGDRLIITYNVNSLDFDDVLADVTKYRPRFVEIRVRG
ncbi:MAG: DUF4185 domain-containing protein [Micromonosporaceae bacterium]